MSMVDLFEQIQRGVNLENLPKKNAWVKISDLFDTNAYLIVALF